MKINLIKFTIVFLVVAVSFYSCQNKENNDPVDIPFTEYSLAGTSCQWTNLNYDDKVIVISSSEELGRYLTSAESGFPAIDFSKHSLLLASGTTTNAISDISKSLQQLAAKYVLDAEITLNSIPVAQQWVIALVISKLNERSNIELNVTYEEGGDVSYPIEIPFEKYSLAGTSCQWINFDPDKLIIINNSEELGNYINCTDDNYPEIDFSKWTLLMLNVKYCNIHSKVEKLLLQQLSDKEYLLSVAVIPSLTAIPTPLIIPVLSPKISKDSQIELNVTIIQN